MQPLLFFHNTISFCTTSSLPSLVVTSLPSKHSNRKVADNAKSQRTASYMYRVTIYTISIYTLRTESLCEAGSLTEDIISNTTCKVHNTSFLCFVSFMSPNFSVVFWQVELKEWLAIMTSLLRCLHDLAMKLIVGEIMYKFDKQCKFYILGQGSTYLFIYYFL